VQEREEGTVITGVNSAGAACQVSSAASSACQRSLGVAIVAKLCHVYTNKKPYVCQRGEEESGIRAYLFYVFSSLSLIRQEGLNVSPSLSIPFLGGEKIQPTNLWTNGKEWQPNYVFVAYYCLAM